MADVLKKMYIGQPSTTTGILYTVPSGAKSIVRNIILSNTTALDATITIYFVPSGGTPGASNSIVSSYTVTANNTKVIELYAILETGDTIQGFQATSGAITTYVSGVEIS